ncbi:hypothetical protein FKM82_024236 [Ascaphus truei]
MHSYRSWASKEPPMPPWVKQKPHNKPGRQPEAHPRPEQTRACPRIRRWWQPRGGHGAKLTRRTRKTRLSGKRERAYHRYGAKLDPKWRRPDIQRP